MKFEDLKVGMKVKANRYSNNSYNITTSENEWEGIVTYIDEENEVFIAETTYLKYKSYIGMSYDGLDPKNFDLVEEKKITTMNEIPLKVTHDRNTIYVIYNNKVVAKATCDKDDNYNEEFGLNLALRRFCKTLCSENTTKKVIYNIDKVEDFI